MAKVLVTGGSGFIGRNLVQSLVAQGDEVTCLVRERSRAEPLKSLGVQLAVGDICDASSLPSAVARSEVVYHLAGLTMANDFATYDRVNRQGTENLLAACAAVTTPPVMVLVSSLAAAGPSRCVDQPRSESDTPEPISYYGRSKRGGELAAEQWADRVATTIVRPPVVFGPGDRMCVTMFRGIRRLRAYTVMGRGRKIALVHVADLVATIVAAAQRGQRLPGPKDDTSRAGCGCYFAATEESAWFPEVSRMIARVVGRPGAWQIRLPELTLWLAGAGGEVVGQVTRRARYLNLDRAKEILAGHWTCSAEKARRELGIAPEVSLETRLEETARWYFDQGWL